MTGTIAKIGGRARVVVVLGRCLAVSWLRLAVIGAALGGFVVLLARPALASTTDAGVGTGPRVTNPAGSGEGGVVPDHGGRSDGPRSAEPATGDAGSSAVTVKVGCPRVHRVASGLFYCDRRARRQ